MLESDLSDPVLPLVTRGGTPASEALGGGLDQGNHHDKHCTFSVMEKISRPHFTCHNISLRMLAETFTYRHCSVGQALEI